MRRFIGFGLVAALALPAHAAPARLTEAAIRAFEARQEAAWNAGDAAAFAAFFTPDARFVDQALGSDNRVVVNGTSTLAQATSQARRFFARYRFHEGATIERVEIAPDGASARLFALAVTRMQAPGGLPRALCARTEQSLVLVAGRIRSRGQTDTAIRCPREVNQAQPR
ncbi:MAG TPA: DUF4440 domain-containing protein [Phenylobacterium sp.]|jgi:ketosteroid isomerase-like protein